MLFVDDVQWADQSSLDLLAVLLAMPDLVIMLAARDGFEPPWARRWSVGSCSTRCDEIATAELVRQTPSGAQLTPERSRELIAAQRRRAAVPGGAAADGPGVGDRAGSRTGRLQFSAYQIPPALRDPLLARLSRPEVDLELAQLAAMIGRDVDRDLLHRAVGVDGAEFERRLRTLLDAGLIELSATPQLRFRHELIREVAYETQRRTVLEGAPRHHRRPAGLRGDGRAAGQTDAAAFHLEQAGRVPHAVAAHIQIAQADQALGAHAEAVGRLTEVLELLGHHPGRAGA